MREVIERGRIAIGCVRRNLPETVFDFAVDEVVDGSFEILVTRLLEITKYVSGPDQVGSASDTDRRCVGKTDHSQAAFGWNSLPVKDLRHDRAAEHLVEMCKPGGVTISPVAGRHQSICLLSTGAQNGRASATARDVEHQAVTLYVTVPDASTVARGLSLSIAMLSLEIACGHVRVRLDCFRRIPLASLQIVLIDDLEREGVENNLFEISVDARRMVRRDDAHLFRERKVEIEDTTVRTITSLIVNITIGANVPPGMRTVYLTELLIHNGPPKGTKSTNDN